MSAQPIRATVWHEHVHEKTNKQVQQVYPEGMHKVMQSAIEQHLGRAVSVTTALLEQPDHGLSDQVLAQTDVMTWWGHCAHHQVRDDIVEKVHQRVLEGMGLIVLHSAHYSKIFKKLMGTTCALRWREAGEKERLWCVNPGHPLADGLDDEYFELAHTEMYGEFFDIPQPDELVLLSWFQGGEVFRSLCTWTRGKGKVIYFRPGHETFAIYHDRNVRRVLANCVAYAAPQSSAPVRLDAPCIKEPLSPFASDHQVDPTIHAHL